MFDINAAYSQHMMHVPDKGTHSRTSMRQIASVRRDDRPSSQVRTPLQSAQDTSVSRHKQYVPHNKERPKKEKVS